MRLRNVKNKDEILKSTDYIVENEKDYKGKWKELFSNKNDLFIEIGMGKGDFIIQNALTYPNVNFIGIEKYSSVLARAVQKLENQDIPNLKLIRMDAKDIEEVFSKEVSRIYLNFSDPWPKKRQAKRRLTSEDFLRRYDSIFKNTKEIIFKTDNMGLFEFSIESLSKYGYTIERVSLDLHNSDVEDNIMTEYEEKFSSKKSNYLDFQYLSNLLEICFKN